MWNSYQEGILRLLSYCLIAIMSHCCVCVCAHRGWPVFSLCQSTTHNNTDNNNHHYDNGTKTCFIIDWYKLNTSKFYQQLTIGKLVKCTPSNLRRNAPCLQAWVNWADKTRYCECQFKQNYIL